MIFSCICAIILLVSVIPEGEAGHIFEEFQDLMDNKGLKRKVMKRLMYYYMVAGNKKVYAIPFPLPLPIPILKKIQPIIYKETQNIPVPVPYEVPNYGHEYGGYSGGYGGGYGGGMGY